MQNQIAIRDLRIFGFIWTIIFAFLGYKFPNLAAVFSSISVLFFFISLLVPKIFLQIKFYQSWIKFGNFIGKINGFIISFILFYGIFTPTAVVLKLLKKDLLNKKLNRDASSYFIDRKLQPGDMKNQF